MYLIVECAFGEPTSVSRWYDGSLPLSTVSEIENRVRRARMRGFVADAFVGPCIRKMVSDGVLPSSDFTIEW